MAAAAGLKRRLRETTDQPKSKSRKLENATTTTSTFITSIEITTNKPPTDDGDDNHKETNSIIRSVTSPPPLPLSMQSQLVRIASSQRTPFEKRVWNLLCQIPRGSFSTYGLLAAHMKSSPRAVGNALRRNPFAPDVPCHRVVATGGALGGFKGKWPRDGEGITLDEKRMLLRGEGVKFDGKGKVVGTPFGGFAEGS